MEHNPIRVLHVIGHMDRGGAETMIMNIYRHIDRTRVQFDFVENSPNRAAYDDEILSLGGRIYRCPHYIGKNHFTYQRWWDHFFRDHGSDYAIVHGHLGSTAAIYLSAAKKHGIFTIAHSHNTNGKGFRDKVYQAYAYPTRKIADFFFACSLDAGRDRFGKSITENTAKFCVLNNAIDAEAFSYDVEKRRRIRTQFGLEDSVVFGHIGRFFEQKNHAFLIDIFSEISKQCENAKLMLVGDGELKEQISRKVLDKGLKDKVIFTGVQEDVVPFYQAMDVFLFPSLYEGLGMVAVEAQATGLPCIISDKVSRECILVDELVSVCSLEDEPSVWAKCAISHIPANRHDYTDIITAKGYNVRQTAKWLADFYCEKANRS